jgi:hypothetical protein
VLWFDVPTADFILQNQQLPVNPFTIQKSWLYILLLCSLIISCKQDVQQPGFGMIILLKQAIGFHTNSFSEMNVLLKGQLW